MGVGREVPVVVTEMGSRHLVGWWQPVMVVPRLVDWGAFDAGVGVYFSA